jgi:hypothetical protein
MREFQASDAKTYFLQLLLDDGRGEMIVITRYGRAVAGSCRKRICAEVEGAIANIKASRQRAGT